MPVLLYQLWAFIAPGLTPNERKTVRPWIPLALFFFALGVVIAYVVLPFAIAFLFSFTDDVLRRPASPAGPYFDFVTTMFLVFGLVMEFPILLVGLSTGRDRHVGAPDRRRAGWSSSASRSSPRSRRRAATSSARSSSAARCTSCSS